MWFVRVEQLFHPSFHIPRHTLEPGMVNPVLGGIIGKGEFLEAAATSNTLIQV
jgi:hypothetical protein